MLHLRIRQDGTTKVVITITTPASGKSFDVPFVFDAGTDFTAALTVEKIELAFHEQIREIRRRAYEQGWQDKTRHHSKAQSFFSAIDTTPERGGCF